MDPVAAISPSSPQKLPTSELANSSARRCLPPPADTFQGSRLSPTYDQIGIPPLLDFASASAAVQAVRREVVTTPHRPMSAQAGPRMEQARQVLRFNVKPLPVPAALQSPAGNAVARYLGTPSALPPPPSFARKEVIDELMSQQWAPGPSPSVAV